MGKLRPEVGEKYLWSCYNTYPFGKMKCSKMGG